MSNALRKVAAAGLLIALGLVPGGCGSVNSTMSTTIADTLPQWAGGLPADAPPRASDPRYDEFNRAQMARSLNGVAQAQAAEQQQRKAAEAAEEAKVAQKTAPKSAAKTARAAVPASADKREASAASPAAPASKPSDDRGV